MSDTQIDLNTIENEEKDDKDRDIQNVTQTLNIDTTKRRKQRKVSVSDDYEEPKVEDLLLTKKERQIIRRKSRQERQKHDSDEDIEDDDTPEYKRIKRKLDTIPSVYKRDDDNVLEEQENEVQVQSQQKTIQIQNNQQLQPTSGNIPNLVTPKRPEEAGRVIQNQVASPPMDESGDVDLNKLFSSEVGNESDVVKELFTQDNIKVKTELTKDEISIISRLELQASMTQNFYLTKILKEMEILRVSKDRKSRAEFVSSFSGIKETQSGVTAFGKLGNIFKNDKV